MWSFVDGNELTVKRQEPLDATPSPLGRLVNKEYYWPVLCCLSLLNRRNFFLILAHPVYKMWIKQEPNMLELWNKLNFEEKETVSIYHV